MATTVALPRTSDGTLTLDELAVLLITSPAHIRPQREGETVIITTKDAYIWAVFFSELVGREGEPERFLNEIREFLNEYGQVFRLMYDTLGVGPEDAADSMLSFMAHKYGLESKAIVERANAAYLSLVQKSLIEDPFKKKVAAFLICMAGLFPQNVTSTTDKGGATVQTYHSRALAGCGKRDNATWILCKFRDCVTQRRAFSAFADRTRVVFRSVENTALLAYAT